MLLIFVVLAIRTSWFQTWLAQQAANYLEKKIGTEVHINKVDIVFFDDIYLEGIYLEDSRQDTLLYSKEIKVEIGDWNLSENEYTLSNVSINDTYTYLRKYEGDSTLNFQYILDAFKSTKEKDTSTSSFKLNVEQITLNNINFLYDDENAPRVKNGIDFSHLNFTNLSGKFSDMTIIGDAILVNIDDLRTKDQSGLILANLDAKALYSPQKISLTDLHLALNNSYLFAPYLALETPTGPEGFKDFLNDVHFKGGLMDSKIALEDVAYFVPQIWGMDDDINLHNLDVNGPIHGMEINDLHLSLLDTTVIKGDFVIPNLEHEELIFHEELTFFRTSVSDIRNLNLSPWIEENDGKFQVGDELAKANLIRLENAHFIGSINEFVVDADLYSGLGNIILNDELKFYKDAEGEFVYHPLTGSYGDEQIVIQNFHFEALTGSDALGLVDGHLSFHGRGFSPETMDVSFNGIFNDLEILKYDYHNLTVSEGRFHQNIVDFDIDVRDPNLMMAGEGTIDLNGDMEFNMGVTIDTVNLTEILLLDTNVGIWLTGQLVSNLHGTDINKMEGSLRMLDWYYHTPENQIALEQFALDMVRGEENDQIILKSDYIDGEVTGKIDFLNITSVLETQLSYVLNNVFNPQDIPETSSDHFRAEIVLKDINPILQFVDTALYVEPNSKITSSYSLGRKELELSFNSERILYSGVEFLGIDIANRFNEDKANMLYHVAFAKPNDSLRLKNLYVDGYIKENEIFTNAGYNGVDKIKPGLFAFTTGFQEDGSILTNFEPSFFHVRDNKWTINPDSKILYADKILDITNFILQEDEDHYVKLDGKVSENPNDWLDFVVHDFNLANLNSLLGGDIVLGGILNIDGGLADVYNSFKLKSDSKIDQLELNYREVGDIKIWNGYNQNDESVSFDGTLARDGKETFQFIGNYFVAKELENLEAVLIFNKTDIGFFSAFEDEELYTDISGFLNGKLDVTGEITNPAIIGHLDLIQTKVKVPMFNVFFAADGPINFLNGLIYTDHLKLKDQENNEAEVVMSIQHTDWGSWNYDITMDMDNPRRTPKFLVMDTEYKEGDYYYGKAYVTGFVNIFGFDDLTEITVDATTKAGTNVTLPLYGTADLSDESFIIFDTIVPRPESSTNLETAEVESTGLKLDMKFHVNKAAKLNIVFDPVLEDQIEVTDGKGEIAISMDEYGEMAMYGDYTINKGSYDMNLSNVKKEAFALQPGSTIRWTGSPYDALIDITASFERYVTLEPIMPLGNADRSNRKDFVYGQLLMSETLMAPHIEFKLIAPEADEAGQDALASISQNQDEVNKQFFALFLLERFFAIPGKSAAYSGELITSVVEDQINGLLGNISGNTSITADLGGGSNSVGVSRQINDRITITTSLGYASGSEENGEGTEESSTSEIVGDVNVEYRLNDDGTFTLNFFNETNQGNDANGAPFTQGVSFHYEETFNTSKDFKLLQRFLNIFRRKENKVPVEKSVTNQKVPLPPEEDDTENEEEE
ncbi:MAG: translocation/assembly module TamB [Crocinitomicaceae bacterium]|nr:translocation/assembly module TamB [Crocinitomicaceae bacterium]